MNTFPLTIYCEKTNTSFCVSAEEVTESYGTLRFKYCSNLYDCDCDYFNVSLLPDSSLSFCAVISDFSSYFKLHFEIFGD